MIENQATEATRTLDEVFADLKSNPPYTRGPWRLKKFLPPAPTNNTHFRLGYRWEYYLTHPWTWAHDVYRETGDFVHRGLYGYARSDIWDLDDYLASWLPDALRHMAENNHGCANELFDNSTNGDECYKWRVILLEMAEGFEAHRQQEWVDLPEYTAAFAYREPGGSGVADPALIEAWRVAAAERQAETERKVNRSLELFAQWFVHLWD